MTIHSLRTQVWPDTLESKVRAGKPPAGRIYLLLLAAAALWLLLLLLVYPMVIMDVNGMIVKRREVVTTTFPAQVLSVDVHAGDEVAVGQRVATVRSRQMLDLISKLTSQKSWAKAREIEIGARLAAIGTILPIAGKNVEDSEQAIQTVERARRHGLSTLAQDAWVAYQRFSAISHASSLRAEAAALRAEQSALDTDLARIDDALQKAVKSYDGGVIKAQTAGVVGSEIASVGAMLDPGQRIAEIYHGTSHVIAYLPTSRLYSLRISEQVVVTDGVNREIGHVQRVEAITGGMAQQNFQGADHRQVARVSLTDPGMFPLLAKVKVTSPYAPSALLARARSAIRRLVARAPDRTGSRGSPRRRDGFGISRVGGVGSAPNAHPLRRCRFALTGGPSRPRNGPFSEDAKRIAGVAGPIRTAGRIRSIRP